MTIVRQTINETLYTYYFRAQEEEGEWFSCTCPKHLTAKTAKLLTKLSSLGVFSLALEWFKSYTNDRQQNVRVGSEMYGIAKSTHGVRQGSILGRLHQRFARHQITAP